MVIYVIAYIALCALALLAGRQNHRKNTFYLLACGILLFLICFRDVSVGSDTVVYCKYFERFRANSWEFAFRDVTWESGYVLLIKLLGYVFADWRGFVFIMGIINLIPFMYLIWQNSYSPAMSLVLFYAMAFRSAEYLYRQWLALLILTIAYRFVMERKLVPFLITVVVAAFFHRTALVFVVVYVLYNVSFTKLVMLASAVASMILLLTGDLWFWLANLVARTELVAENNGGVTMLAFLWLCVGIIYMFSRYRLSSPWFRLNFVMLMIAAVTQPICFTFSLWSRIVLYFRISLVFLLPWTVKDIVFALLGKPCKGLPHPWLDKVMTLVQQLVPTVCNWVRPRLPLLVRTTFYLALFVYFWANGVDEFKLMPLF